MSLIAFSAELPFTALMNRLFGGAAATAMESVGLHPGNPQHPIPNSVAMQVLLVLGLMTFFLVVRVRLSVASPGIAQHIAEWLHGFIVGQTGGLIGHGAEKYYPFLTVLFLYVLGANLMGVIPSLESPTAHASVPLGCAMASFVYYNFHGIRAHGPSYVKQFLGPVLFLSPLVLLIEIISHLARLLSLTVRLWANIFAGDMVTLAFFSLVPIGLPVLFWALHIGVSLIQAFIFMILGAVYIASAVSEEH